MVDATHFLILAVVTGGLSLGAAPERADLFLLLRPGAPARAALALVLEGAPLDIRDSRMATPLHAAAAHSADPALIRAMLERGADPAAVDGAGRTPLHEAAAHNPAPAIAAALIAGDAPLDAMDGAGRTALHLAADPGVAALLVLSGADPCRLDGAGRQALSTRMLADINGSAQGTVYAAIRDAWLGCL